MSLRQFSNIAKTAMDDAQKPYIIGTADLVLADVIIDLELIQSMDEAKARQLMALVDKFTNKRGDKVKVKKDVFEEVLVPAIDNVPLSITPGGSSANALSAATMLMADRSVRAKYLGFLAPGGIYSSMIARGFREAQIDLEPNVPPPAAIETAVSFVFVYPDRQRNIITYPGNADQFLTPDMVTEDFVRGCDMLFMQGSMWKKFDPEIANRMFRLAQQFGIPVHLALPTNAFTPEEQDSTARLLFDEVIHKATKILGNESEVRRMFRLDHDLGIGEAAKLLQKEFRRQRDQEGFVREAMITSGARGAILITPDGLEHIKAVKLSREELESGSTLGAGDASFGFKMAGDIAGMSPRESVQFAMKGAAECCKVLGARVPDPISRLATIWPQAVGGLTLARGGKSVA